MGSPVFFKQKRPGKDGKIFNLIKFRTMRAPIELATGGKITDAERLSIIKEKGEGAVTSDAQRLTKFGELLRKLSIDELPELINILKGEMSIVGPRPLAVIYLPYYNEQEKHRHDVLPGLTGLAQVHGRNNISWEERFKWDLRYVNNVNLKTDLYIVLKTIGVVIKHNDIEQGDKRPEGFHVVRQREWDDQNRFTNK